MRHGSLNVQLMLAAITLTLGSCGDPDIVINQGFEPDVVTEDLAVTTDAGEDTPAQ